MASNLLIVESPAKAKTLKKYLGKDFEVLASYGHVRDLIPKTGAVDPDDNFAMKYETIARNSKHVDAIAKAAAEADHIFLAPDPDREGEAIAWHISELLKGKRALKGKSMQRVVFYEITQSAVKEAVAHPREISIPLVNAQQARRALDYLVGFGRCFRDGIDMLAVARDGLVLHGEVVVGIDCAGLGNQVAHVTIGREDFEVLA